MTLINLMNTVLSKLKGSTSLGTVKLNESLSRLTRTHKSTFVMCLPNVETESDLCYKTESEVRLQWLSQQVFPESVDTCTNDKPEPDALASTLGVCQSLARCVTASGRLE